MEFADIETSLRIFFVFTFVLLVWISNSLRYIKESIQANTRNSREFYDNTDSLLEDIRFELRLLNQNTEDKL